MGRKKQLPLLENITITSVAAEGKAFAKVNDVALFVPYAIPGDIVNVQVVKKRSNYMEGVVKEIVKPSSIRIEPFCQHYGICGGCKWQALPYTEQLKYKQQQVEEQLSRIGHFSNLNVLPIIGSEKTTFYRNKLEYTFSNKRWLTQDELSTNGEIPDRNALGFHIPGMFDKVLDIKQCYLQQDPSNAIRLSIKDFAIKNDYSFFDLRAQEGLLRNLIIRTTSTGELMVIVIFYKNDDEKINLLMSHLQESFPQITSLLYVVNGKGNDTIFDQEIIRFAGRDHIEEQMEGLRFKIGAKSFYQTNSEQAYKLYSVTRDFAKLTGNELVYDLYTGTGTIANFIAKDAKRVIGVEYIKEAIDDAWENARANGIENASFYAGDMKDVLNEEFVTTNGKPDVIILDPPRAGIHPDVAATILKVSPQRIVYVSCNPATQARDLSILSSQYRITSVQPVDMFPHTHHVENVVCCERSE